jgi:hypothetical protein
VPRTRVFFLAELSGRVGRTSFQHQTHLVQTSMG